MFTGLVEDVGTVLRADRRSNALVLAIKPARIAVSELVVGESVCHDGACLTVTETARDSFTVLAGLETLERTTLGAAVPGFVIGFAGHLARTFWRLRPALPTIRQLRDWGREN